MANAFWICFLIYRKVASTKSSCISVLIFCDKYKNSPRCKSKERSLWISKQCLYRNGIFTAQWFEINSILQTRAVVFYLTILYVLKLLEKSSFNIQWLHSHWITRRMVSNVPILDRQFSSKGVVSFWFRIAIRPLSSVHWLPLSCLFLLLSLLLS